MFVSTDYETFKDNYEKNLSTFYSAGITFSFYENNEYAYYDLAV